MIADVSYFVLLFLAALIINSAVHIGSLIHDRKTASLIQLVIAFGVGVALTFGLGHGVLAALNIAPGQTLLDSLVTGLTLAAASDNLNIVQALGADVPQKPAQPGALPDTVQVSGQIKVQR